jgi:hypothetical protein
LVTLLPFLFTAFDKLLLPDRALVLLRLDEEGLAQPPLIIPLLGP